jgi:hypothetical protein
MRATATAFLLLAGFSVGGCETARTFGDLRRVQQRLVRELHEEEITVNLSDERLLTISLINSPLRTLSPQDKEAKARVIARSAVSALGPGRHVESVAVVFVVRESKGLFFTVTDARDSHAFLVTDLERGVGSMNSGPPNDKMQLTSHG